MSELRKTGDRKKEEAVVERMSRPQSKPPSSTHNPMLDDIYMDDPEPKTANNDEEDAEMPKINLRPTLIIIACAMVGLVIGISLADDRGSPELISWIKLPGDLFIRALKAVVLPLVFVNIILAVVDMIRAGKASSVGVMTIVLYTLTTLIASLTGLAFILIFQSTFSEKDVESEDLEPIVKVKCPLNDLNGNERFLTEWTDGGVRCMVEEVTMGSNLFEINNLNGFLQESENLDKVADDITFSQTLQDGIFRKIVSDNIVNEFIQANFVGVITFAIAFGASSQALKKQPEVVVELLEEMNRIFLKIIDWIIFLTPIAVLSLIAGNIGEQKELGEVFKDIGVLMLATILAMLFHFLVTYPLLFFAFVRESPFVYMKFMFPLQIFAFASASSAASLPIALDCVASTKKVPPSIANFVLSMGSTLNMDGGAIYFPTAVVFLAVASGLKDELDASAYFLIILLSTIGSAGTAPVPSASLVLILTAYNTVFDESGTPDAFALIFAIDWLMDRFRTTLNVTGDTFMARIITAVSRAKKKDDILLNAAIEGENIRSLNEIYSNH